MLLMQKPQLLLLDEPVAGMTPEEMDRTIELLHDLEGEQSIMVVEHDMEFVRAIAHKVTVLHQGSVLAEGTMGRNAEPPRRGGGLSGRTAGRGLAPARPLVSCWLISGWPWAG